MNTNTVLFFLIIFVIVGGCNDRKKDIKNKSLQSDIVAQSSDKSAYFYIENNIRDFGTIQKDKENTTTVIYEFTNTGNQPLVCIKASLSCGCMEAEIPTQPIRPGEKGEISIKVDIQKEEGRFNKNVIIKTNAENDVAILRIKGNVK